MKTFQEFLSQWEQNKSKIHDNNFFYFDRDITTVVGLSHFPLRPGRELIIEDPNGAIVRVGIVDATRVVPDIRGIDFKVYLSYASASDEFPLPQSYLSGVKGMLEYCVQRSLRTVWYDLTEVIATHLVENSE